MSETYKAFEVTKPGDFSLANKPLRDPGPCQVRIRVEACGVCHSDAATVDGLFPIEWPRVPGHEVVGKIDALGSGVQGWTVGQRVGVGFLAGSCGYCEFCRNGDLVNCKNQEYTGIHHDGGYAEVMIAKRMPTRGRVSHGQRLLDLTDEGIRAYGLNQGRNRTWR